MTKLFAQTLLSINVDKKGSINLLTKEMRGPLMNFEHESTSKRKLNVLTFEVVAASYVKILKM